MAAITATQYLFRASVPTSTTLATVGAYTVPAGTRGQIVSLTLTNTATTQRTTYCDVSLFDGSTAFTIVRAAPLFPGGFCVIEGAAKHVLPTSGAVYIAAYATVISAAMSLVELT